MKIKTKILLYFFSIVVISTLSFSFFGYNITKNRIVNNTFSELENLAEAKEGQIFVYLDSIEGRTLDFSSDGLIRDLTKEITETDSIENVNALNDHLIRNKKSLDETIAGILILDINGKVIASTDEDEIGKDESEDIYFIEGKKGVFSTELSEHEHFGLVEVFAVSSPLTDKKTGSLLGVIVNIFNTEKIDDVLSGRFQLEKGAISGKRGFKESLEVYIVDDKGVMFVHPNNDSTGEHFEGMKISTLPILKCLMNQEETTGKYTTYDGTKVFGTSMCLKSKGWVLIAEISQKEALLVLREITTSFVIVTILVLLMTLAVYISVLRTITKPLKRLHEGAEKISAGNLDYKTGIRTEDELGQLSRSFDKMANEIKRSKKNLQKQVEGRTKALNEKVGQLEKFQRFSSGREKRMIELKEKIKNLEGDKNE